MKESNGVVKGIFLIVQLALSMVVPIAVGIFLGYLAARWLETNWPFALFVPFGILAGYRNCYLLLKGFWHKEEKAAAGETRAANDDRREAAQAEFLRWKENRDSAKKDV